MSQVESPVRNLAPLLPPGWESRITQWLSEDIPKFDIGGYVVSQDQESQNAVTTARLLGKSAGVLAGVPFANEVFRQCDCKIEWLKPEGSVISEDDAKQKLPVAKVTGHPRSILQAERTALNILSRASGIASQCHKAAQIIQDAKWHGVVAGTRKTTPGFGFVEKYALLVGGLPSGTQQIATHRMDLSHMCMLKDNHVWITGSISRSVKLAKSVAHYTTKIEVECRSETEAREAIQNGADIIMLDNFSPESLKVAAKNIKNDYPHVTIEASGGIRIPTMKAYFSPYVDVISQGSLTQGYPCLDFSLKVSEPEKFKKNREANGKQAVANY